VRLDHYFVMRIAYTALRITGLIIKRVVFRLYRLSEVVILSEAKNLRVDPLDTLVSRVLRINSAYTIYVILCK
jgi:hypothetical protein